jgi:hypothetical protein
MEHSEHLPIEGPPAGSRRGAVIPRKSWFRRGAAFAGGLALLAMLGNARLLQEPGRPPGQFYVTEAHGDSPRGAVGDGVTDDTAAINAAIDRANARATGAVVVFPPGTYLVTGPLRPLNAPTTLRGSGPSSSALYVGQRAGDVITLRAPGACVRDLGMRVRPNLPSEPVPPSHTSGAFINLRFKADHCLVDNVTLIGAFTGIRISGDNSLINHVNILDVNSGGQGIEVIQDDQGPPPSGIQISHFYMGPDLLARGRLPSAGIRISSCGDCNLTDCDITNSSKALLISNSEDTRNRNDPASRPNNDINAIYAENCFFDASEYGIFVQQAHSGQIVRCHFVGCWAGSHAKSGVYFSPLAQDNTVDSFEFIGLQAFGNGRDGVEVGKATNVKIVGSSLVGNARAGVYFYPDAANCVVQGSKIGPSARDQNRESWNQGQYGVYLSDGSHGHQVSGNDFYAIKAAPAAASRATIFPENPANLVGCRISQNLGYNPVGAKVPQPPVPAPYTNLAEDQPPDQFAGNQTGMDCMVYISVPPGSQLRQVKIGGVATGPVGFPVLGPFLVPAGGDIGLHYVGEPPSWRWFAH